jgi:hypothetical protein
MRFSTPFYIQIVLKGFVPVEFLNFFVYSRPPLENGSIYRTPSSAASEMVIVFSKELGVCIFSGWLSDH